MTGRERIFAALDGMRPDRTPWVPFAGVHGGKLCGFTAREVSTDLTKLEKALEQVNRLYVPDGQPVMFDLQIEAEILGCQLVWSEDAPPSVNTHPLKDTTEIPARIPQPDEGRLPMELEAIRFARKKFPDTAIYAVCAGPFTLAGHLRGTDVFMDMALDPDYVEELLAYTTKVVKAVSGYLIDAGADVVAVTDPLVSQISPDFFEDFMDGPFTEIFDSIRARKARSAFFVCGNATRSIEPMCNTHPDAISIDENVNLPAAKVITDKHNVCICGNIPLTSVMLFGTQQDNAKYILDMEESIDASHLYIASPGCDMPYDIPVENTIAAEQAVHQPETAALMVRDYKPEELVFHGSLPDYEHLSRPLVEVFTLDSATCAACTYMKAAAIDAQENYGSEIDVVEYKYTSVENIARCKAMGVKQLPSIYINGKLAFSSIIPDRETLIKAIKEA
jgi:uroporphyrinogen decarboxylase